MTSEENQYLDFRLSKTDSLPQLHRWDGYRRKIIFRNTIEVLRVGFKNQENRMISSKFCVDRKGDFVYVEILPESNADIPQGRVSDVLKGFAGYRVEPDTLAPLIECGKILLKIKSIHSLD